MVSQTEFFPQRPEGTPTIYAYELPGVPAQRGWLKVGYTARDVRKRVDEQLHTAGLEARIVVERPAFRSDGSVFDDSSVHALLTRRRFERKPQTEWFRCSREDVESAIAAISNGTEEAEADFRRTRNFKMRPEQLLAVERTEAYFREFERDRRNAGRVPHFLWNAKMRFGKTFAAYQLAKRSGWKKILILTFVPAVKSAWEEDLLTHVDFEGWDFFAAKGADARSLPAKRSRPLVCFGSFQDLLGKNEAGGIKAKNEWIHETNWDCVILDEYHYGAWRERARELFGEDGRSEHFATTDAVPDYFQEDLMPITTRRYLYLSGTPFRALASGEFIEEQIFNWTYSDEQMAKSTWKKKDGPNPYAALPRMVLMTYQLPDDVTDIANGGEFDEFDLNEFFSATGTGDDACFRHKDEVQKWLSLIRGSFTGTAAVADLRLGNKRPPMPFSHAPLLSVLNHTFWFLPSVAACFAMRNLLRERQNGFFRDYSVIVAAGTQAGIGEKALQPVLGKMREPLKSKTITLSCGKLTTGVSVKPWTGIFMLKNLSSPETYFQAAFRVQTPWSVRNFDGHSPNEETILKKECYVFDFAPNRALRQVADYACRLAPQERNPEKQVSEFIKFLPILAYDGSSMRQIDAEGVLEIATSGTTATLLAKRWESALLVNVDNVTLEKLMRNTDAMEALKKIEAFRNLNQEISAIINKSEKIKKTKARANDEKLSPKEKKELSNAERELKAKRKEIQEKLMKFAARIPVFMYLTDFRENCLHDVITQLESGLFKKVTGLDVKDFELLLSLNVFNGPLINDAIFKFRRYEDASLSYTGIDTHVNDRYVGGFDTALRREEHKANYFFNESAPR